MDFLDSGIFGQVGTTEVLEELFFFYSSAATLPTKHRMEATRRASSRRSRRRSSSSSRKTIELGQWGDEKWLSFQGSPPSSSSSSLKPQRNIFKGEP